MAKAARGSKIFKKFAPLIEVIAKIGAKTPRGLQAALKAEPDRYIDLVKAVKTLKEALGAEGEEKKVWMIDIPWLGGGAEVSIFWGVANYTALWDSQ